MDKTHQEINLQKLGMKRRKKEVRHMKIMTALTVLFLALTLLFQDNMNQYQMEMNYKSYGEWLLREPMQGERIENPYLVHCGEIWSGSTIYQTVSGEEAERVEMDPSDEERYTGKILGTLDEEIIKTGKISLYEGKMPEQDHEIAMELNVLQALGCNYDLGQQITFYVAENEDINTLLLKNEKMILHRVSYTLVGTLCSYSDAWSDGDVLPGAVITKNAFDALEMTVKGYQFSRIQEKYKGNNTSAFALNLADGIKQRIMEEAGPNVTWEELGYAINVYAYDNPFWSNPMMYRNMTIILIILGVSIMAYLMSSYLSKRRKYYYRMREIGATVGQIWTMTVYECIGSTVFTALGMVAGSYGISLLLVFGVAKSVQIPFFYVFRWETLYGIILCVASVLSLAMLCAFVILRGRRVTEKRKALPFLVRKRLLRRVKKHRQRISMREIWKRQRICHPVSVLFSRLVGIGVCLAVLACLMQINEKCVSYRHICKEYHDFTVSVPSASVSVPTEWIPAKSYIDIDGNEKEKTLLGGSFDQERMYDTIPDSMIQETRELSGIRQVECSTRDQTHVFDWKGKGESPYYQFYLYFSSQIGWQTDQNNNLIEIDTSRKRGKEVLEEADQYIYEGRYYQNCRKVWEDLDEHLDQKIADYTSFRQGKQVILLEDTEDHLGEYEALDAYAEGEEYVAWQGYIDKDGTLRPGDTLTIQTGGKDLEVEIAGILSVEEMDYQYGYSPYCIVGSETLGRNIAREDGKQYGYNHIEINFNDLYSSEATDKIITRKCTQNQLVYDSNSEVIRAAFQKVVQAALVYGTLAVIVFVLYLFVLSCILQEESRKRKPQMETLHQLGISWQQMNRFRIRDSITEALYLLCSVPILYLVWILRIHADWDENAIGYSSLFFNKTFYELTECKYIFYQLLDYINIYWVAAFIAVVFGTVVIIHIHFGRAGEEE